MYTTSRAEKKVAERLVEAGVEVFLPMVEVLRQWSDRKKKVQKALFNGYVFVKTDRNNLWNCLQTPGAVKFVNFSGVPAYFNRLFICQSQPRKLFPEPADPP